MPQYLSERRCTEQDSDRDGKAVHVNARCKQREREKKNGESDTANFYLFLKYDVVEERSTSFEEKYL